MGVIFQSPGTDQMKVLDFWLAGFEADTLPLDEETDLIESSTDLKRISI
jgi:hypothetical protein